eukprot:2008976-Alexandrium_andersonii.AAC.1
MSSACLPTSDPWAGSALARLRFRDHHSASAYRIPTSVYQALQTACSGLQRSAAVFPARPPRAG